jgi:hypothetical protein
MKTLDPALIGKNASRRPEAREKKRTYWLAQIEKFEAQPEEKLRRRGAVKRFCEAEGYPIGAFRSWYREIRGTHAITGSYRKSAAARASISVGRRALAARRSENGFAHVLTPGQHHIALQIDDRPTVERMLPTERVLALLMELSR